MRHRTMLAGLLALVATLAVLAGVRLNPSSSPDVGFASPGKPVVDFELEGVPPQADGATGAWS